VYFGRLDLEERVADELAAGGNLGLPTPVGPIMMMFLGVSPCVGRRELLAAPAVRMAMATAFLAARGDDVTVPAPARSGEALILHG